MLKDKESPLPVFCWTSDFETTECGAFLDEIMFWKYNLITASHIGTLLDKENVQLKELMNEEDVLQECKAQNKKLIDFLVQPVIMDEMVTLITQEPDEHLGERVRYKYANIACELLTFDIAAINDALVSEVLLNKLYNFLDTDKPLNPLLASFFSKTMGLLLVKKSDILFKYLKSKSDFINLILNHIETSAIMDLLLKFLTFSENENELRTSIIKWLNDQNIVKSLVGLIDPAFSEDSNCNAAHALCDTIKASREYMSLLQETAEPEPLLEAIESTDVVLDLLNHMFSGEKKESVIVNGISVLLALLEFKKHGPANSQQVFAAPNQPCLQQENAPQAFASFFFRNDGPEQMTSLDAERLSKGVNNSLAAISPQLVNFHKLLSDPPAKPSITLTIGRLDPPFGSSRLEVAHLITALISTNTHDVNVRLSELGTIPVLMDLFFQYKWNNFLHTQVEHSLGRIISNAPTIDEEGNKVHPLLDQILTKYKITHRILECFKGNEQELNHPDFQRKGYMGHLTKVANHIAQGLENGVNSSLIQEKLKGFSEDHCQKWEAFINGPLAEINKKNTAPLVGGISLQSSSGEDEAVDFRDIQFHHDSALPQPAFPILSRSGGVSEPLMMQMASNFVDQFAFNDEYNETDEHLSGQINRLAHVHFLAEENMLQRNAELFEQVCRDKHQAQASTEDVDSDEDVWEDKEEKSFGFREKKCVDDNSSDSDEENNAPSASTSETTANDDMKMEIDNQDDFRPESASLLTAVEDLLPVPEIYCSEEFIEELKTMNERDAQTFRLGMLRQYVVAATYLMNQLDFNRSGWTANFDSVPMDVAPITIQNPWETVEQPSSTSDEQENWADFSNFSSFSSASTVECSNEISSTTTIAMETSDPTPNIKFVSSSEVSSTSDGSGGDDSHIPAKTSATLDNRLVTSNENPVCDRMFSAGGDSTSSKDLDCEAKPLNVNNSEILDNRQKDSSLELERESCSSSTVQNGPV